MVKRVYLGPVTNDHVRELTDINAREFGMLAVLAIAVLAMVVLGGMGNIWGVILGAVLTYYFQGECFKAFAAGGDAGAAAPGAGALAASAIQGIWMSVTAQLTKFRPASIAGLIGFALLAVAWALRDPMLAGQRFELRYDNYSEARGGHDTLWFLSGSAAAVKLTPEL